MENSFSFLNEPALSALKDAASLLPGLEQVDLLYTEVEKNGVQHRRLKANTNRNIDSVYVSSENLPEIKKLLNNLMGTRWYDPNELPFSDTTRMKKTVSIFDEILKSVLCIGFQDSISNSKQVFVFYFKIDASEFGPMREDKVLETTQKIVIERLLFSSLKAILNNYIQNRKAMADLNKNIQGLILSKQQKINEQDKELGRVFKEMDTIVLGLLNEINTEGDIIKITEGAKRILRKHLSNTSLLKSAIKKALVFAKTISFGLPSEEIVLHEDYFSDLAKHIIEVKEEKQIIKADQYSVNTKLYKFLDSLEKASHDLAIKGVKLTSSNVGGILEQPITAAAISDKLKNHGQKINLLLQQYPDNWVVIRNKFRPVVNIQEKAAEFKVA